VRRSGVERMAAWLDLSAHLERTIQRDERLHCESIYRGAALPAWLQQPLRDTERNAGDRVPCLAVNVKGRRVADTVCIVKLSDLERLLRA